MLSRLLHSVLLALALSPLHSAGATELTVSAASSLTEAFKEIANAFMARTSGTTVRLNFASSGTLLQQIAKGAPVDVFASADLKTMDDAQQQGLIVPGQRHNFAANTLVVIVPAGQTEAPRPEQSNPKPSSPEPSNLRDLAEPAFRRIAIGNPASVPVGRYTRSALESAKLWSALQPRLINAQNARQVLDYVARGEVDAGFVYATDAAIMPDKVKTVFSVALETPVLYPIAPVVGSANGASAQAFVDFVTAAPAREILARHGFSRP